MKTYKAIFDIPDNITPPPVVGFQIITPVQTDQGTQMQPTVYKTALIPIDSMIEDCEDFTEVSSSCEQDKNE